MVAALVAAVVVDKTAAVAGTVVVVVGDRSVVLEMLVVVVAAVAVDKEFDNVVVQQLALDPEQSRCWSQPVAESQQPASVSGSGYSASTAPSVSATLGTVSDLDDSDAVPATAHTAVATECTSPGIASAHPRFVVLYCFGSLWHCQKTLTLMLMLQQRCLS